MAAPKNKKAQTREKSKPRKERTLAKPRKAGTVAKRAPRVDAPVLATGDAAHAAAFVQLLRWAADVHDALAFTVRDLEAELGALQSLQSTGSHQLLREYAAKHKVHVIERPTSRIMAEGWIRFGRKPFDEVINHARKALSKAQRQQAVFATRLLRGRRDLFALFGRYTGVPAKRVRELSAAAIEAERQAHLRLGILFADAEELTSKRNQRIYDAVFEVKTLLADQNNPEARDRAARAGHWAKISAAEQRGDRTLATVSLRLESWSRFDEGVAKVRDLLIEAMTAPGMTERARAEAEARGRGFSTHAWAIGIVAKLCNVDESTVEKVIPKHKPRELTEPGGLTGLFSTRE